MAKKVRLIGVLLPIIMLCVCVLLGAGTLIFLKLSAKHKKSRNKAKEELAQITANEFVNVKDIRGNFLYTRDNLVLAYLKIYPISTELFSKNEKRLIAKQLTVSLSSMQSPFQLLAVSRPVDISPLFLELSATLTASSDVKQKELLKQEIVEMGTFALSGEVVERQFYIKIWDNSVGNQREFIHQYIEQHSEFSGAQILEFCDDGYSGTNMERPAVKRLLRQVREREINCIIVKDMSRFGRDYIIVGDYLEQIFPFLDVRFIAINDGYDSKDHKYGAAGLIDVSFRIMELTPEISKQGGEYIG